MSKVAFPCAEDWVSLPSSASPDSPPQLCRNYVDPSQLQQVSSVGRLSGVALRLPQYIPQSLQSRYLGTCTAPSQTRILNLRLILRFESADT